jgi:hypothetical protein
MCGDSIFTHKTSVEEMIAAIVAPPAPQTAAVVEADRTQRKVHFNPPVEGRQKRQGRSKTNIIKTSVAPPASVMTSNTSSPMEDDIELTATIFEMKEEGKKPRQQTKVVRRDKVGENYISRLG